MDEEAWKEPTEEEMKVIKAQRERSDKISQLMAQYLLKGYKMLDSYCASCSTILLQDKEQKYYCVACSEIDNEHSKDETALNGEGTRLRIEEFGERTPKITENQSLPSKKSRHLSQGHNEDENPRKSATKEHTLLISKSERTIETTWEWAVNSLENCKCVDSSIRYCNLIKACADALISLKQAQNAA